MKKLKPWACLALAVCVFSGHAAERQQVMGEVYRNGDGNWEYRAERYVAVVHGKTGRLQSLVVEGKELLAQGQPDAAGGMLYAAGKPFAVEITGCNGRRIKGEYSEPVKAGKFPVILGTPHPGKDLRVGATEPTVMVYGELDDVAKYRQDIGDLAKSNETFHA